MVIWSRRATLHRNSCFSYVRPVIRCLNVLNWSSTSQQISFSTFEPRTFKFCSWRKDDSVTIDFFWYKSCYAEDSRSRLNRSLAACSFKCSKHDPNNFLNNDAIHCNEATHFLILEFPRLFECASPVLRKQSKFIDQTFCKHEPEVYFCFWLNYQNFKTFRNNNFGLQNLNFWFTKHNNFLHKN